LPATFDAWRQLAVPVVPVVGITVTGAALLCAYFLVHVWVQRAGLDLLRRSPDYPLDQVTAGGAIGPGLLGLPALAGGAVLVFGVARVSVLAGDTLTTTTGRNAVFGACFVIAALCLTDAFRRRQPPSRSDLLLALVAGKSLLDRRFE